MPFAKRPIAVANVPPLASAWQSAELNSAVLATLPELQPAMTGAAESTSAPAAKALPASSAMRCGRVF
jgi:hypothetical protein